jgi:hypothetical protein
MFCTNRALGQASEGRGGEGSDPLFHSSLVVAGIVEYTRARGRDIV